MLPTTGSPRRSLTTAGAAQYLGISASLLRKMRSRGPDDPLGPGPQYIKLSPSLIVYDIATLDTWLEAHSRRQSKLSPLSEQELCRFLLLDRHQRAGVIRRLIASEVPEYVAASVTGRSVERVRQVLAEFIQGDVGDGR